LALGKNILFFPSGQSGREFKNTTFWRSERIFYSFRADKLAENLKTPLFGARKEYFILSERMKRPVIWNSPFSALGNVFPGAGGHGGVEASCVAANSNFSHT
jgi:hypothetical protein